MCTGITYSTQDHYFGRNLDLELSYGQKVVVTPRNFTFPFRKIDDMTSHYAMIGMSAVVDDYPLPSIIVKSTKIKTHGETWKSSFGDVSSLHWNLIFKKIFPKKS